MSRRRDPVTAADRDDYHDVHRIGFWLLVGKTPGPYTPREPVLNVWRDYHTNLATVGDRIPITDLVDHEHEPVVPVAPVSETRLTVAKQPRADVRTTFCVICKKLFYGRNNQQACGRKCGTLYRDQKRRLSAALSEQKAKVRALRCSPSLTTTPASDSPPDLSSASPPATLADSSAPSATASVG